MHGTWYINNPRGRRGMCKESISQLKLWVRTRLKRGILDTSETVWHLLATGWWFSPGIPVSSTNKTDRQNIAEILLKVEKDSKKIKYSISLIFVFWPTLFKTNNASIVRNLLRKCHYNQTNNKSSIKTRIILHT